MFLSVIEFVFPMLTYAIAITGAHFINSEIIITGSLMIQIQVVLL